MNAAALTYNGPSRKARLGGLGVCVKTNLKINSQWELQLIHFRVSDDSIETQTMSAAVCLSSNVAHERLGVGSDTSDDEGVR